MSDVEDSHSADSTNNKVEEVTNEQYRRPRPDDQNNTQLTKRLKLVDPSHVLLIEDILHHLFSFFNIQELVKMGRVCKMWQIVSRQKIKFASTASFHVLEKCGASDMNISSMKNVLELSDKTVAKVYIQGSYRIIASEIRPELCQILSDNCPNLTRLSLSSINMSHIFCCKLGRCLPSNLRTLVITTCSNLNDHNFGMILGNCKKLENLVMVDESMFEGLSIIENLKSGQLKKLSLTGVRIDKSYLVRILEMFKSSLRELELNCLVINNYLLCSDSNNMLLDFKFSLLETFRLEADDLNHGDQPGSLFLNLKWFLNAMPNLNILKLDWCRFTANKECYFKLLPKCVPLLKELHIRNSLPRYRPNISFLSKLENLETLVMNRVFHIYHPEDTNYSDSDIDDEFHLLPDQAKEGLMTHLVDVIIKCPKLKTVIFDDLPLLNDGHVFTMISSMSSLRVLGLGMNDYMITGSFVSKCVDLHRTDPIKVYVSMNEDKDSLPAGAIPPFLELCLY